MKTVFIFVLISLILLGLCGFYFFSKTRNSILSTNPSPSPSAIISPPQPTINIDDLKAGGSSYSDPQNTYSFLYPTDFKLDTQDKEHTRIYKSGPTQRGQTEMYDGVIMVFEIIDLQGKTLDEWVNSSIKQAAADGSSEIISAKKAVKLNKYQGFTYSVRGLGESTHYVIQKDTQSKYALVITTSVNDPQNIGFQTEVNTIFQTINLLK